jgi:hypothetical protein
MDRKEDIVIAGISMMGILRWLQENYKKKTGTEFTVSDVQGYILRGQLPGYIEGGLLLETIKSKYSNRKYNIVRKNKNE